MPTVATVLGAVDTASLGQTLMHEHLFSLYPELRIQESSWDEEVRVADAVDKLRAARALGISTLVDLTVYGLGRNLKRAARVASESGMNVIGATGVYFFSDLPAYFVARTNFESPTFMEDLLVREIEEGVFETGIKAAIIKCATDHQGVTPDVNFGLRASAHAQIRTGVPISTHTHAASESGIEQLRIFREEGVDLGRVIIGHSGDTADLDYLQRILDAGAYLGMDRFGVHRILPFDDRVRTVAALCERGYADRIVLSHDANCWSDALAEKTRSTPDFADMRFTYISERVLPGLREAGVSEAKIEQMLVVNPRRIFEAQA
jgi:phosphotriesterase-related protein